MFALKHVEPPSTCPGIEQLAASDAVLVDVEDHSETKRCHREGCSDPRERGSIERKRYAKRCQVGAFTGQGRFWINPGVSAIVPSTSLIQFRSSSF